VASNLLSTNKQCDVPLTTQVIETALAFGSGMPTSRQVVKHLYWWKRGGDESDVPEYAGTVPI